MAKKTIDPPDKKRGKKAVIIANAKYDDFKKEYERTKDQYAKYYPGGVEFIETAGYEGLEQAFGKVDPEEDLIMMAHHNKDAMFGVPVSDPSFRTFDAPEGKTLATLFTDLQSRGYKGNCYLGICKGEETAKSLQGAGVNIPMFSTPEDKKWFGANPGTKGGFEDFFFGVSKKDDLKLSDLNRDINWADVTQTIDPEIGKDFKLNISPQHQDLMNRRMSGEQLTQIEPLKNMKNGGKANFGGIVNKLGGAEGITNSIGQLAGGLQMLSQEKDNKRNTKQLLALSNIVNEAAGLRPDEARRQYVRPEDNVINPGELYPTYGTGSGFIAKNGKSLPVYQGGGNVGSILGSFIGGGKGQQSGAGQIGSTVGSIAGSFLGPLGTTLGGAVGGLIGGVIGGGAQKKQREREKQIQSNIGNAAFQQGMIGVQNQYGNFMKDGGKVAMGGELRVYNQGGTEVISQNPYLPGTGETLMFNGPSHESGGIPISFGNQSIEVEGGEPAVKLKEGGTKENLTIFGDMKIPPYGVSELNDPKAKNKKFKNYINILSKEEEKANKVMGDGLELINEPIKDSHDKLRFSSGKAMLEGSNMKLKNIAEKKQLASLIQDAILQTAEEFKLDSGELAKGNIKKAKKGAKIAQDGTDIPVGKAQYSPVNSRFAKAFETLPYLGMTVEGNTPSSLPTSVVDLPTQIPVNYRDLIKSVDREFPSNSSNRNGLDTAITSINSILPYIRPSNKQPLDPNQLSGEMFALATNQLEPVQAQTYTPLLESQTTISLQDQLNANQSDFNALLRQTRNNPSAQSILAAQKYNANSSVLGEQFRINQDRQTGTMNRNRAVLNDATLKNLAILDQQYERQSRAKSSTKSTAQAALNSIADKISRNKLENRTLGIYENLYNYRFGPGGQAINMNPLAQFNIPQVATSNLTEVDEEGKTTTSSELQTAYDNLGRVLGSKKKEKVSTKNRNGGIVKALRSLT